MSETSFLLDTHIWIWLINGESLLSKKTLNAIDQAARENAIFVSAISLWEVSMLEAKQKIILERPCLDWINVALKAPNINLAPLTAKIAVESCHLPKPFHGDPADRIITATARIEGHTLITRDKKILEYSKGHHISAIQG